MLPWAGLVVTSQTAVEAVSAALAGSEVTAGLPEVTHRSQLVEQWKGKPVFVVGKATAQAGEMIEFFMMLYVDDVD